LHPFRFLAAHRYIRNTLLMLAVVLIVLPAALSDGHERHARPQEVRQVAYRFQGTFHVADSSVTVLGGNRHVRRAAFVGQTVTFDLSAARVRVADVNGDGSRDAADLQDGDTVVVRAFAPRRAVPHSAPLAASRVVDRSHRAGRHHHN
jgi:hypothetical protein